MLAMIYQPPFKQAVTPNVFSFKINGGSESKPEPKVRADIPLENAAEEFIEVYDNLGRKVQLTRTDWLKKILLPNIKIDWDDYDKLYHHVVQGLNDNFAAEMKPAAKHLYELRAHDSNSIILYSVTLMKTGSIDAAKKLLSDYLIKHPDDPYVLTNLAKAFDAEGNRAEAKSLMWKSLQRDPNQDNGLSYYLAMQRESGGDGAYRAALQKISEIATSWRSQLWLAREALKEGNLERALSLYKHVLSIVPLEPDLLTMIGGDLGNANRPDVTIKLISPIYDVDTHGPYPGMNLLEAYRRTGSRKDGEALLHLMMQKHLPHLRENLLYYSNEFAKIRPTVEAVAIPKPENLQLITLDEPLWYSSLERPAWLLPQPPSDAPQVLFLTLTCNHGANHQKNWGREDDAGRLTRSTPLYLADYVRFNLLAKATTLLPLWPGLGFVLVGEESTPEHTLHLARRTGGEFTYAVTGKVVDIRGQLSITMSLLDIRREELVSQCENLVMTGAASQESTSRLTSWLADKLCLKSRNNVIVQAIPDGELTDRYMQGIGQHLSAYIEANPQLANRGMFGEREIIAWLYKLCVAMTSSDMAALHFLSALILDRQRGSNLYLEFEREIRILAEESGKRNGVLYLLNPLIAKLYSKREEFDGSKRDLRGTTNPEYSDWLTSLSF